MKKTLLLAFVCLYVVFSTNPNTTRAAEQQTVTAKIRILEKETGNPIGNATGLVTWKNSEGSQQHKSCNTTNEGDCTIYGVPAQELMVGGTADGFCNNATTIHPGKDFTTTIKLFRPNAHGRCR